MTSTTSLGLTQYTLRSSRGRPKRDGKRHAGDRERLEAPTKLGHFAPSHACADACQTALKRDPGSAPKRGPVSAQGATHRSRPRSWSGLRSAAGSMSSGEEHFGPSAVLEVPALVGGLDDVFRRSFDCGDCRHDRWLDVDGCRRIRLGQFPIRHGECRPGAGTTGVSRRSQI